MLASYLNLYYRYTNHDLIPYIYFIYVLVSKRKVLWLRRHNELEIPKSYVLVHKSNWRHWLRV